MKQATAETATYGSEFVAADHGHQADLEVSWGTHWFKILVVW